MKYTTKKGDTFDIIAYNLYGNAEAVTPIMDANPDYIKTAVFDYGVELDIPDLDTTTDAAYLPPWRI